MFFTPRHAHFSCQPLSQNQSKNQRQKPKGSDSIVSQNLAILYYDETNSLTAAASDFTGGFPNGIYSFTRNSSQPFKIEFTSVGINAADFSVNVVDSNGGLSSPFPSTPSTLY
jgi:hypothetical protein